MSYETYFLMTYQKLYKLGGLPSSFPEQHFSLFEFFFTFLNFVTFGDPWFVSKIKRVWKRARKMFTGTENIQKQVKKDVTIEIELKLRKQEKRKQRKTIKRKQRKKQQRIKRKRKRNREEEEAHSKWLQKNRKIGKNKTLTWDRKWINQLINTYRDDKHWKREEERKRKNNKWSGQKATEHIIAHHT